MKNDPIIIMLSWNSLQLELRIDFSLYLACSALPTTLTIQ